MLALPHDNLLPVDRLASSFRHVTNSYKYYWFLAVLETLEAKPDYPIMQVEGLALRMLSLVWYPLDFYKLSFGKQDSFKLIAEALSKEVHLNTSFNSPHLYQQMQRNLTSEALNSLAKRVKTLVRYVPYRFQHSFISEELRGLKDQQVDRATVEVAAKLFYSPLGKVMYRYHEENATIELHPLWMSYLQRHLHILRGFTYFELIRFLQKHNPHVPGLSEKLFRPHNRNLSHATTFWSLYLQHNPDYRCPYSSEEITLSKFSLDHFVPWSYVAHDLLWNLLPVPKEVNSAKGNALPSLSLYFPALCARQYNAFKFLLENRIPKKERLLEDYATMYGQDLTGLLQISQENFNIKLGETIRPLVQVATNIGFKAEWTYRI